MARNPASKSDAKTATNGTSGKVHYEERKRRKQADDTRRERRDGLRQAARTAPRYALYAGVVLAIGAGVSWWMWDRSSLPPITMAGHTEALPPGYILTTPMPETIQKHMLEHAGGTGAPGIIIQYNCDDFACEPGLVEKLAEVARDYPGSVYLAPNRYTGKIILTKLDAREILEQFDERAIRTFITR